MIGIKSSKTHKPLLFRSYSLLTLTTILGRNKTKFIIVIKKCNFGYPLPMISSVKTASNRKIIVKSTKHQYSNLDALP